MTENYPIRGAIFLNDNGNARGKASPVIRRLKRLKNKAERLVGTQLHWWQVFEMILNGTLAEDHGDTIVDEKIVCHSCRRRWKRRDGEFPTKCPRCRVSLMTHSEKR